MKLSRSKKCLVGGLAIAVAGLAAWLFIPGRKAEPVREAGFHGVRDYFEKVTYSDSDPESGVLTTIGAAMVVVRDKKVGGIFRSPLSSEIQLGEVTVTMKKGEALLLTAAAPRGTYGQSKHSIELTGGVLLTLNGVKISCELARFTGKGMVEIPVRYEVTTSGGKTRSALGYKGPVEALAGAAER